ncbi:protein crossbronx isoform X1 [Anastrepha ludens]|uniref:protein crossbronx isoform X1 n=1 Tax=Anastrepha ludens TaxID=28586 RepID=UPI0023B03AD3|nr:protein crossbronx isoform X1 [Anastrepha ludens]
MTLDAHKEEDKLLTTIQQEYKILAEYKMIESEKIGGVYVIPSYGNSLFVYFFLVWFGVIFVRQGFYVDAIFRFTILLPDKFPDDKTLPTVIFQNEIIHPLICPYTGSLDISCAFPYWRSGEDHIWQLLKYIQAIFVDPIECGRLTTAGAKYNNAEAAELLTQNRAEFIARAKDCATTSKERIYDEPPTEDPHYIVFEKFDADVHGPVRDRIFSGKELAENVAVPTNGLSWVKEGEFKPLSVD